MPIIQHNENGRTDLQRLIVGMVLAGNACYYVTHLIGKAAINKVVVDQSVNMTIITSALGLIGAIGALIESPSLLLCGVILFASLSLQSLAAVFNAMSSTIETIKICQEAGNSATDCIWIAFSQQSLELLYLLFHLVMITLILWYLGRLEKRLGQRSPTAPSSAKIHPIENNNNNVSVSSPK